VREGGEGDASEGGGEGGGGRGEEGEGGREGGRIARK